MFDFLKKTFALFKKKPTPELSVLDYPRGAYTAYWEIYKSKIEGGHRAEVRVNLYGGGQVVTEVFTSPTTDSLQKQINDFLKEVMKQYKRM